MLQIKMLKKIFGRKREYVRAGWKKLHNEELHKLYYTPNISKLTKYRRMSFAAYVACKVLTKFVRQT